MRRTALWGRGLPLLWALVLCGCSRDVPVTTVLEDTGGLQPGDRVYLGALEVGSVEGIAVTEQTPDFTVNVRLYPEAVERIQANAVAYVPFDEPPRLVLLNPSEQAAPVARGGRLDGLSPFAAALWQAQEAAVGASDLVDRFARRIDSYFASDDWTRMRDQLESEAARLAEDSSEAAERISEEFRALIESITDETARSGAVLEDDLAALEQHIDQLEADGYPDLAASLRRLLARIESLAAPSETPTDEPPPQKSP